MSIKSLSGVLINISLLAPHDNDFNAGENYFGFYGDFFTIFNNWQWYSEDVEAFEFSFVPTSVGCLVRILRGENGETLDLTHDVNW